MILRTIPHTKRGDNIAFYYLAKLLNQNFGHNITLISFLDEPEFDVDNYDLKDFYHTPPISIDVQMSLWNNLFFILKNMFSKKNLFSENISMLNFYHTPEMHTKIDYLLENQNFDCIICEGAMAQYVSDINIPKIVVPFDAISESCYEDYRNEKNLFKKIYYFMAHRKAKYREMNLYKKFDRCIVVTHEDKKILEENSKLSNVLVVPLGTDISYNNSLKDCEEDYPSILYVGVMSSRKNMNSVKYFYYNIYSQIKDKFPRVKFFIVGSDPGESIKKIADKDESILLTGFVDDIKEYYCKSSVVIAPIFEGTGLKSKVLEAMAMAKPLVTTSIGVMGIEAKNGKEVFIADTTEEFAFYVNMLLEDKKLGNKMGLKAKELIKDKYSWEKTATSYNEIICDIIN